MTSFQIPLLNHYSFIEKNLKIISTELQEKAGKVNIAEQSEKSQRDMRQSKECCKLRSLPDLVGEGHVFGHLHMWFVFLLRSEIYRNIPHTVPECPVDCSSIGKLRDLYFEIPNKDFQKILYCILTGICVIEERVDVLKYFLQLLPNNFRLPTDGKICKISKHDNNWSTEFSGCLPKNIPKLVNSVEMTLTNKAIPESTLQYQTISLIMRWFNIACVIGWAPSNCDSLFQSLGVQKCDMPVLSYWIPQSLEFVKVCTTNEWFQKCTSL